MHQVAFSADIAKMYRQKELEEDRNLWEKLKRLRTAYGIAFLAFHSIQALHVLAEESDGDSFWIATLIEVYVYDLLSGSLDIESAIQLHNGFINTLATAGFEIRNWTSNFKSSYVIKTFGYKPKPRKRNFLIWQFNYTNGL